ncbi:hypothetical protein D3C78_611000 [compost metagenome]
MLAVDVGAGREVVDQGDRAIDHAGDAEIQRAERAGTGTDGGADLGLGGEHQRAGDLGQVGGLDLVQLVVAAHQQGDQGAFLGAVHHQGLDGLGDGHAELGDQLVDGLGIRGVDQTQFLAGGATRGFARDGLGLLDVGGVVGAVAEGDVVFAGLGQHVELVGAGAADGAGVGLHRTEVQAQAGEHVAVGLVHAVVGFLQRLLVEVEGVGVLHQEFAAAHQAEARADLVAELGLDLEEVDRQLLVAVQLVACQVGDDLFMGRADAELAIVAVLDAQQLGAVLLPAPGFLPQLGRLDRRHQHLEGAGGVHFLAHDVLHLAQHAQAHRQPGVQAGGELADHPGAQQQLVADDHGVGGGFFQGRDQILAGAHGLENPVSLNGKMPALYGAGLVAYRAGGWAVLGWKSRSPARGRASVAASELLGVTGCSAGTR